MRSSSLKITALLGLAHLSVVVAFGQDAVQALKTRLVNQAVAVRIEGLRVPQAILFKAVDIRVVDGTIQKRMFDTNLNTDELLYLNERVRVTKVESSTDKKSDYLRLTIASPDGLTVPVAFVLLKGTLAGFDESQLAQIVGSVFSLPPALQPVPVAPLAPIPPPPPPEL